jgi:hypothetical protein
MSKRLDGSSLFSGISAGLTNSFSLLSSQYSDGLTVENLNKALTNTNVTSTAYGATSASYLTTNFNSVDTNRDGIISADEILNLMNNIATQGLTREQIMALGSSSGMTNSLQETVLAHFDDIDTNIVKIAFDVAQKLRMQSVAFDFVYDANLCPKIVEICFGFGNKGISQSQGYWTDDMVWHPSDTVPFYEWIIEGVISNNYL